MEKFLIALALTGVVDAISYMVVAPSIVFYVLQVGGTKEQYGLVLSAFSFASFCAKPFLGAFSDNIGFRFPYISSLAISCAGGFLYLIASRFESVRLILAGRILGGVGAANSALAYAYISKMVPNEKQTRINSLLSMVRIFGMAAGPGMNIFLAKIDTDIFGSFHLDSLNSVGLVLMLSNLLAITCIFFLLEEPPSNNGTSDSDNDDKDVVGTLEKDDKFAVLKAVLTAGILVPMLAIFTFNANFQLIETGFAPAANHALGWGPIQTSAVLGSISIIICFNMFLVYQLSARNVRDEQLAVIGLVVSIVGYTLMYTCWKVGVPAWLFCLPIVMGASSFPFLGAPTRSVFTKYVDASPCLENYQGTMQAVLSMGASVAGFVTPGFVAYYVLRHGEQVDASADHRELTPWALLAPALSLITLLGYLYIIWQQKRNKDETALPSSPHEASSLLVDDTFEIVDVPRKFCPRTERYRRQSACLMGLAQVDFQHEHIKQERRKTVMF